eukprot:maker-scaffold_27-snap-gene-2.55-mRNA-1 protein AED:0.01 eAED:0.01 QI:75/1/1/1/1/1/3/618/250
MSERRITKISAAAAEHFIKKKLASLPEDSKAKEYISKVGGVSDFIRLKIVQGKDSASLIFDDRKYKTKTFLEELLDSFRSEQIFTRSFKRMVRQVFDEVDIDGNGYVDKAELYAAILLLYHRINSIPWGGRKPPPRRVFIMRLFDEQLKAQSGDGEELSYEGFERLCRNHFKYIIGSVFTRVLMVGIIFPWMAMKLTSALQVFSGVSLEKFEEFDTIVSSGCLTILVLIYPYAETFFTRRVYMDKNGFAT